MRIALRAGFDTFSGYGNDAVDIARFLERGGADVIPCPLSVVPGLPREFTDLLTKQPVGSKPDAVITFAPPTDIVPSQFALIGRVAIGYSMWERTPLLAEDMRGNTDWEPREPEHKDYDDDPVRDEDRNWWSRPPSSTNLRRSLDQMWVTCPMNVEAFDNVDPHVPKRVIPCGIDTEYWPQVERTTDRPFTFGMCGVLSGRKDPFVLLQVWRELKEEMPEFDARLVLKTNAPGLHPKIEEWSPDTKVILANWKREQVRDWYADVDVLISTSRGEGNNKPAMEFMCTGGPAMATDWSGHQNWLHPACSYPLKGELQRMTEDSEISDFRVSPEHLKETLLHCWSHPEEVREKGQVAARFIRESLSWESITEKMMRTLAELL